MKRVRKKWIFFCLLSIFILASLVLISDTIKTGKKVEIYDISVIVRGKNSESWMIMREGMEQASSEMNVNFSFITLSEDNSVEEQKGLIDREINNGVDGIIVAPADYRSMKKYLEEASKKIPIVQIESKVESKMDIPYISCDNYRLGKTLASEITTKSKEKQRIIVVKNNIDCSSIYERYLGFIDEMMKTENTVSFWQLSNNEEEAYEEAKRLMENNVMDVLVTFEPSILEVLGKSKKDISSERQEELKIAVHGAGSTNKIISYLEEGVINSTAMQNEFSVGYLGVKTLVDLLKGNPVESSEIYSTIINGNNMYSKENQRLLFPFIK